MTTIWGRRAGVFAALLLAAATAAAHHGWAWTEDGNFELTGKVTQAQLGNPHGLLKMDVAGEAWTVEVGQPWRNERAGLTDKMMAPGAELTVSGQRSADAKDRRLKAERVIVNGKTHNLYPDRN